MGFLLITISLCLFCVDVSFAQNTTVAATNIESTLGLPALLVDPTAISDRNTTDSQYETILKISPFANETTNFDEATTFEISTDNFNGNLTVDDFEANNDTDYDEADLSKQLSLPNLGFLQGNVRRPCECQSGICGCCTGMFITALRQFGCVNITYSPEDFSFELKMIMNEAVLYKSRVTGRNPPPVCVKMPRFNAIKVCVSFYDLYFVGRNMHVCLEMGLYFRQNEVFNRSFDCMRIGDKGVKLVKPEDGSGLFHKPGTDAEVDAGFDDIEDYDENAVVRRRREQNEQF